MIGLLRISLIILSLGYSHVMALDLAENAEKRAQQFPPVASFSPMAGIIKEILKFGPVRRGDTVLILEAMKMEHRVRAIQDGWIALEVGPGNFVHDNQPLFYIHHRNPAATLLHSYELVNAPENIALLPTRHPSTPSLETPYTIDSSLSIPESIAASSDEVFPVVLANAEELLLEEAKSEDSLSMPLPPSLPPMIQLRLRSSPLASLFSETQVIRDIIAVEQFREMKLNLFASHLLLEIAEGIVQNRRFLSFAGAFTLSTFFVNDAKMLNPLHLSDGFCLYQQLSRRELYPTAFQWNQTKTAEELPRWFFTVPPVIASYGQLMTLIFAITFFFMSFQTRLQRYHNTVRIRGRKALTLQRKFS